MGSSPTGPSNEKAPRKVGTFHWIDFIEDSKPLHTSEGVVGENSLWLFGRECSDASCACNRELLGSRNVTESHWTLQSKSPVRKDEAFALACLMRLGSTTRQL